MRWITSSYSTAAGNCVQVAHWRKSTRCGSGGCVEIADIPSGTAVRDSKDPAKATLVSAAAAWAAFLAAVRAEQFHA